jgi:hypothetical protein
MDYKAEVLAMFPDAKIERTFYLFAKGQRVIYDIKANGTYLARNCTSENQAWNSAYVVMINNQF